MGKFAIVSGYNFFSDESFKKLGVGFYSSNRMSIENHYFQVDMSALRHICAILYCHLLFFVKKISFEGYLEK